MDGAQVRGLGKLFLCQAPPQASPEDIGGQKPDDLLRRLRHAAWLPGVATDKHIAYDAFMCEGYRVFRYSLLGCAETSDARSDDADPEPPAPGPGAGPMTLEIGRSHDHEQPSVAATRMVK